MVFFLCYNNLKYHNLYGSSIKGRKDLRGNFSDCKAEEQTGLTPADDETAAERENNRKDIDLLMGEQHQMAYKIETEEARYETKTI